MFDNDVVNQVSIESPKQETVVSSVLPVTEVATKPGKIAKDKEPYLLHLASYDKAAKHLLALSRLVEDFTQTNWEREQQLIYIQQTKSREAYRSAMREWKKNILQFSTEIQRLKNLITINIVTINDKYKEKLAPQISAELRFIWRSVKNAEKKFQQVVTKSSEMEQLRLRVDQEIDSAETFSDLQKILQDPERKLAFLFQDIADSMSLGRLAEEVEQATHEFGPQWQKSYVGRLLLQINADAFPEGVVHKMIAVTKKEAAKYTEINGAQLFLNSLRTNADTYTLEQLFKELVRFNMFSFTTQRAGGSEVTTCSQVRDRAYEIQHRLRFVVHKDSSAKPNPSEVLQTCVQAGIPQEFGLAEVISKKLYTETVTAHLRNELQHPENINNLHEMQILLRLAGSLVQLDTGTRVISCTEIRRGIQTMLDFTPSWVQRQGFLGLGWRKNNLEGVKNTMATHNIGGSHPVLDRIAQLLYAEVVIPANKR